jgi:hypothetical protein
VVGAAVGQQGGGLVPQRVMRHDGKAGVSSPPSNEFAVPAQQCLWCHQKRCPPVPRRESTGGGEQDSVEGGEPGTAGLAAQHAELVSEHQDLQILGGAFSAREDQQACEHADEWREEQHRRMVWSPCSPSESGFRGPQGRNLTLGTAPNE